MKVALTPPPCFFRTVPSKTWILSRLPSLILALYFYSITNVKLRCIFFHLLSFDFSDNFVHCVPPSSWTFLIPLRYQRTISSFHNCFILSYFVNSFKHFPHLLPKVPAKTSFLSYPELRFSCTFPKDPVFSPLSG